MAKYLFVYHGAKAPTNPDEIKTTMDAWGAWFELQSVTAVIDGGNPVGQSSTVKPDGSIVTGGGANPASGYSLIEASEPRRRSPQGQGLSVAQSGWHDRNRASGGHVGSSRKTRLQRSGPLLTASRAGQSGEVR